MMKYSLPLLLPLVLLLVLLVHTALAYSHTLSYGIEYYINTLNFSSVGKPLPVVLTLNFTKPLRINYIQVEIVGPSVLVSKKLVEDLNVSKGKSIKFNTTVIPRDYGVVRLELYVNYSYNYINTLVILKKNISVIIPMHEEFEREYLHLVEIKKTYTKLLVNYSKLKTSFEELKSKYQQLQNQVQKLKQRIHQLELENEELKQVVQELNSSRRGGVRLAPTLTPPSGSLLTIFAICGIVGISVFLLIYKPKLERGRRR